MPPVNGDSSVAGTPAVFGASVVARGVEGHSTQNHGVVGQSTQGTGVFGTSENQRGVEGHATKDHGVVGVSKDGTGVFGTSENQRGVEGHATKDHGVVGVSTDGTGVFGTSENQRGVEGHATKDHGVVGVSKQGAGVFGITDSGNGSEGHSTKQSGVFGKSREGVGVFGESKDIHGVSGISHSARGAGIFGRNDAGGLAASFIGAIQATGDVTCHHVACQDVFCSGGDIAEEFAIANNHSARPGTVMVLSEDGGLKPSDAPYDGRVVGVIAGAGNYRPGILLDRQSQAGRQPIAMVGKTYCMVDASYGAVGVGDLLTSSGTAGHAMKAVDATRAFGAVIGKAMRPLVEGRGLIPILLVLG